MIARFIPAAAKPRLCRSCMMRMFVFLAVVAVATSFSLISSADGSRGLSFQARQEPREAASPHCAKRMEVGNETVCLMQRRSRT